MPKKHGRGGQSKNRFARIRQEKRHNYLRKVAELATGIFISNDRPNIKGLVLGGSAEFKDVLFDSDLFDPRLKKVVIKIVDIQYSGDIGFNQAIDQTFDILSNVKLVQEKKLLTKFFDEIAKDTYMYCFGIHDTMKCLEMGAIDTIILWEDLDVITYEVYESSENDNPVLYHLTPKEADNATFRSNKNAQVKEYPFVEWMTNNYKKFGCSIELVTDRTQDGTQFVKGFGGIGGFLRYRLNLIEIKQNEKMENTGLLNDKHTFNLDDDDFM